MLSIKELVSPYRGSEKTYEAVKEQILERWGEDCAEEFDPHCDAMPYTSWMAYGYQVRKGQKALKSITFIDSKDAATGEVRKIKRIINLFHRRQVEKTP